MQKLLGTHYNMLIDGWRVYFIIVKSVKSYYTIIISNMLLNKEHLFTQELCIFSPSTKIGRYLNN